MRPDSPFYKFTTDYECVVNVFGVEKEPIEGTNGLLSVPRAGTLRAVFHKQGRLSAWPNIMSADSTNYDIKLFSAEMAQQVRGKGITGIEFHPVVMKMGELKGLARKVDQCPVYMWARVLGIVLVDIYCDNRRVALDPGGRYTFERRPSSRVWTMQFREEQPEAADFSRMVPGGTSQPIISKRVAEFIDGFALREVCISARASGWL